MHTSLNIKTRQHGAVLVISLLILLVLTLVGVSSLDGSIMEEKMASNSQIAAATFQQAESAIREAYFQELTNPLGAVSNERARTDDDDDPLPFVNRDRTVIIDGVTTTITSTSLHAYNPDDPEVYTPNSSLGFAARVFEIQGSARIGAISSINVQGYLVSNTMPRP